MSKKDNVIKFPGTKRSKSMDEDFVDGNEEGPIDFETEVAVLKCPECDNMTFLVEMSGEVRCAVCRHPSSFQEITAIYDELTDN